MNAYAKSIALGLTGSTAEKVAVLRTLTLNPIPLAELIFTLNFRGMLTKVVGINETEKWRGSILTMKSVLVAAAVPGENATEQELAAAAEAAAYALALDQWLSHITNPRNLTFDTTNPLHAATFAALYASFGDPLIGIFQDGDFDAIYDLGGGRPYADLIDSQLEAQATEAEAAAEKADLIAVTRELEVEFDAKLNQVRYNISTGAVTTRDQILSVLLLE